MFSVSTAMKPVIARANRPHMGSRSAAALGEAVVLVSRMIAASLIRGVVVRDFAEQLPAAIDLRAIDSLIPDVRGHRFECDGDGALAASERLLHVIGGGACQCDLAWFARWQGKMLDIQMWHGDFPGRSKMIEMIESARRQRAGAGRFPAPPRQRRVPLV